jgi:purine-binding chemotaxis protein CheW
MSYIFRGAVAASCGIHCQQPGRISYCFEFSLRSTFGSKGREVQRSTLKARSSKHMKAAAGQLFETARSQPARSDIARWVVFCLDAGRYALPLAVVDRIVRAAHVTPLPQAPPAVLGAIDVEGHVLPVFNLRHKFGLPGRTIDPADQFLIARAAQRTVVLVIDAVHGVLERPAAAMIDAAHIAPTLADIRGVIPLEDGLVLIHDLEVFLSPDEARVLDDAMNQDNPHAD